MGDSPEYKLYPHSLVELDGTKYALYRDLNSGVKRLWVFGNIENFSGPNAAFQGGFLFELEPQNAAELRKRIDWLFPKPLGLEKSFGFGDRLGLATPGHILALANGSAAPVFAQQSVRENARTGRTPQNVLDDAMWGVFQVGWKAPWGADADHIKTLDVVDAFIQAGFTMFTIDPGDHVENHVEQLSLASLKEKASQISWGRLGTTSQKFFANWLGKEVKELGIVFGEKVLLEALVKYGRAITHTAEMYQQISKRKGNSNFDFEVSVDETDSPTSIAEHYFIASELRRLGVRWTSLAPRFIGRFEKGVDYIGDLDEFDRLMQLHANVARHLGGYKISLHSGSDKFSVYPSVNRHTVGLLHVKTAGTSYLEALRVVAEKAPRLFDEILAFAINRYEIDKASYHVSGRTENVSTSSALPADLLNQFDARQVFHVTYGSVLERFGDKVFEVLVRNEEVYYNHLERHFTHHLELLG